MDKAWDSCRVKQRNITEPARMHTAMCPKWEEQHSGLQEAKGVGLGKSEIPNLAQIILRSFLRMMGKGRWYSFMIGSCIMAFLQDLPESECLRRVFSLIIGRYPKNNTPWLYSDSVFLPRTSDHFVKGLDFQGAVLDGKYFQSLLEFPKER